MNNINLSGIKKGTWARIIGLFVILANQVSVSVFDFQLIPFADEQVYEGVSTLLTIIISIYAGWKDTPVTTAAQAGHAHTKRLKGVK